MVPQWLQRGFSCGNGKRGTKVAVYRKGAQPLWTNTGNVGVRKSFFTSAYYDGDSTVTSLDSELAPIAEGLRRNSGPLRGDDARNAARLFGHLEVRQQATERVLRKMQESVGPLLVDRLTKTGQLEEWIGKPNWRDWGGMRRVEQRCTRRLRAGRASASMPVDVGRMVHFAQHAIESLRVWVAAEVTRTGERVQDVLEDYGRRWASGEVLEDAIIFNRSKEMFLRGEATSRVTHYERFEWRVVQYSEDLILPDSMVFHETMDSALVQNFLYVPESQVASYLPIGSRTVLVGHSRRRKGRPLQAGQMRYRAAQACFEFFVASKREPAYRDLARTIGTYRRFATAEDWRAVAEECLAQ